MVEGYCVKCKEKREMKDTEKITMKNGRPATKGRCTTCDCKMFKIGAQSTYFSLINNVIFSYIWYVKIPLFLFFIIHKEYKQQQLNYFCVYYD